MEPSYALAAICLTGVALGVAAIFIVWRTKAWGKPSPQRLSDDRLSWCIHDMERWLRIKRGCSAGRYQKNAIYLRELRLESLKRSVSRPSTEERFRKMAIDKYIPLDTRALELVKAGLSDWEADKQAHDEWSRKHSVFPFNK